MSVFDPSLYDPAKAVTVDPKTGQIVPNTGDRYNGLVIPGNGWPSAAKGRFPESTAGTYDYLFRSGVRPRTSPMSNTRLLSRALALRIR